MSNKKGYDSSIGLVSTDDWMERERRYEARHSPWDLDDNASYLDEEHRRHCEAREVRKEHEKNCEVERPDYSKYAQKVNEQFRSVSQQLRSAGAKNVPAKAAERSIAVFFAIVAIIIFMSFISIFIQILLRF